MTQYPRETAYTMLEHVDPHKGFAVHQSSIRALTRAIMTATEATR